MRVLIVGVLIASVLIVGVLVVGVLIVGVPIVGVLIVGVLIARVLIDAWFAHMLTFVSKDHMHMCLLLALVHICVARSAQGIHRSALHLEA